MPIHAISKYKVILTDYSSRALYWKDLTIRYKQQFKNVEVRDPKEIKARLHFNFGNLIELFESKLTELPSASFFMFIYLMNDNLNEIYQEQLNGLDLSFYNTSASELALQRRIYKIILEQFVKIDLYHDKNIEVEIKENFKTYSNLLDNLLYIGVQIYQHQDFIAQNDYFPKSFFLPIQNDFFDFTYDGKFKSLLEFVHEDSIRHDTKTDASNILKNLMSLLDKELDISHKSILLTLSKNDVISYMSFIQLEESIEQIAEDIDSDLNGLNVFIKGLTLTKENALSLTDTFLRSQRNERFTYRPVLKLTVNNQCVYKTSESKISESLTALSTNAIPYGYTAEEWIINKKIRKHLNAVNNANEFVLQNEICKLLTKKDYPYSESVKSILTKGKSGNINLEKSGPGEIDIIYLEKYSDRINIVIAECKNNRFRGELYNWIRDYDNFLKKYEKQLSGKVEWAETNKELIIDHFIQSGKFHEVELKNKTLTVSGIFIINSATLYLYDGIFDVYTLTTFEELMKNKYKRLVFHLKEKSTEKITVVNYPFFRNIGFKRKLT